jgi:hypothetical protein
MENEELVSSVVPTPAPTPGKVDKKEATFFAMVLAALWVAGWSAYGFISGAMPMTSWNVIASGLAIAGCFCPIYISVIIKAVKELKE